MTYPDLALVNLVYRSFLSLELLLHTTGFIVSFVFFRVFANANVFHKNLRLILTSFCVSFTLTSLVRTILCFVHLTAIEALQIPTLSHDSAIWRINDFFIRARDTALYAGALHMLLLAIERLLATALSKTYETLRHDFLFLLTISFMWSTSIIMMFFLKSGKLTQYIFAAFIAISQLISIGLMLIVYRLNFCNMKAHQGTLDISHGYQVRENISASRLLNKIFLIDVALAFTGLSSYFGYVYFEEPLYCRMFGFVFDVTVALPSILVPLMLLMGHPKLRREAGIVFSRKGRPSPLPSKKMSTHFIDFNGKKIPLKVKDEQAAYFSLYQAQWDQVTCKR